MVLVGILLGASAAGIFYYQKWSVWQRQEHYARTLFLAAQSGMTQYSTDKHLEEFDKEAQTSAQAIVRQNKLLVPVTDENGQCGKCINDLEKTMMDRPLRTCTM